MHNTYRSVYLRVARVWPCCGYHAGMFTQRILHPVTHDIAAADHAPGDHAYVHRESRKIFPSRYPPDSPCCAADSSAALEKCCQQVRQLAGDTSKVTVPRLTRRSDTIPFRSPTAFCLRCWNFVRRTTHSWRTVRPDNEQRDRLLAHIQVWPSSKQCRGNSTCRCMFVRTS